MQVTNGRFFPPWVRWLVLAVAAILAVALVAATWDRLWAWLPWSDESRLERTQAERDAAVDQSAADALESEGQAAQVERVETTTRVIVETQAATAGVVAQARSASDAADPLSPDRADRLRAHDRELCRIAPGLTGCAAAPDPAGPG